jgi:serine/threonine protein phosphatase 1
MTSETIYAIGDIHGQRPMLEDALDRIERDGGGRVVFLGDYVDRGPDSKGVIDLLATGVNEGRDWICIKGNHDRLFEWYVTPPEPRHDPHLLISYHWLHPNIGGVATARSYDLEVQEHMRQGFVARLLRDAMPDSHLPFLQNCKLMHREGGLLFVHAGIRPGVPLDRQDEEDLVWIRQEFHNDPRDHGVFVVHGHTPVETPDFRSNRLNLDTGAGFGRPLSIAVFEGEEKFLLTPSGRLRLC